MKKVLWATMVYEGDKEYLLDYFQSIKNQIRIPDQVLIVDAGNSAYIRKIVERESELFKYFSLAEKNEINRGFNPSFNFSLQFAINNKFEYLATITVRCRPRSNWLKMILKDLTDNTKVGMVTTLHIDDENGKIHNLGHFLSNSGGLYDFARGISLDNLDKIQNYINDNDAAIWCPCSGGALYNVKAIEKSSLTFSKEFEIFHPFGFKSYNCSNIGYLLRANNYQNLISINAICNRDKFTSTSNKPTTCGLLINQEINRIANILTFWPENLVNNAIEKYLVEKRINSKLKAIDKTIVLTLANNLAREWEYKEDIFLSLLEHINLFAKNKDLNTELN